MGLEDIEDFEEMIAVAWGWKTSRTLTEDMIAVAWGWKTLRH